MAITSNLSKLGIEYYDSKTREVEVPSRIVVANYGMERSGKTHFALTMPGPIGVVSVDPGSRSRVRDWQTAGKSIYFSDKHRRSGPIGKARFANLKSGVEDKKENLDEIKRKYAATWEGIKDTIEALLELPDLRGLVIDQMTDIWDIRRIAEFGKLSQIPAEYYVNVKQEFRTWVEEIITSRTDINIAFIHKADGTWVDGADGKRKKTNKLERKGFDGLGFMVDINLEHAVVFKSVPGPGGKSVDVVDYFRTRIVDSRQKQDMLAGLVMTSNGELEFNEEENRYVGAPNDWETLAELYLA